MSGHKPDGSGFRDSLATYAPQMREADPANGLRAAARAWHEMGLIVINPDHVSSWTDRKQAELLAERMYGKRKGTEG